MKLILGCGYLGRRVAARWIEGGHHVSALTRSRASAAAFRDASIEPIVGDVTAPASLDALPAAETLLYSVGFDRQAGHSMREVYVGGLSNVIERIAARVGRLIYISSTSVYGQSDGGWVDESSPCEPTSDNGRICLEAENAVRDLKRRAAPGGDGCETVILRLSGLYGPGRLLRRVEELRSGRPLGGNPDGWLNLIHVDDASDAVLAAERHAASGTTHLITDDRPVRRREYFERLAALVGAPHPVFEGSDAAATGRSPGKRCSNHLARQALQWKPRYSSLADALPLLVSESTV